MSAADRRFEPIDRRTIYEGRIVTLAVERFRFADGAEVEREVVHHRGAVGALAHDDTHLVLVRQPREALGDPDVLEIPAGRLDRDGEAPLAAAQRELAEEVGLQAERWEPLVTFHHSPGFCDELQRVYLAQGLTEVPDSRQGMEEEAMTIEWWPLADAVDMITSGTVHDAKTVIGLLLARDRLNE